MSSAHAAIVVRHSDQIVSGAGPVGVEQMGRHVQTPRRKLHQRVDLVAEDTGVRETLQVDDEDVGEAPEVKLFGGLLVFLAVRTVPGNGA